MRVTPPASMDASSVGEIEARAVGGILAEMGVHVDQPALAGTSGRTCARQIALERSGGVCEFGRHGAAS